MLNDLWMFNMSGIRVLSNQGLPFAPAMMSSLGGDGVRITSIPLTLTIQQTTTSILDSSSVSVLTSSSLPMTSNASLSAPVSSV